MTVVFDTNVFVSAFVLVGSKGERALRLAQRGRCCLHTSVPILTETANTLRDKFHQSDDDITSALKLVSRVAIIVRPEAVLSVLVDEPDNRILECASEAGADLIVTGDRHLLDLQQHAGTTIVRLADFLRMFPGEAA